MSFLAERMSRIDASGIRKVFALAANLQDPINLSIGQPDFDVDEAVKQDAIAAIEAGLNKYTQTWGLDELRDEASAYYQRRFGTPLENVMVTSGVSGGLFLALLATINPGDEVIFADPYFVMYKHLINLLGGVCRPVSTYPDFKFKAADIEAAITPKTKMIIVNSPCNPTGVTLNQAELKAIAGVAAQHGLLVISDEIYFSLVYDDKEFTSFGSVSQDAFDRTILVNGVSKSYAMTGWRIGYAAASKQISKVMANYLSHSTGAPGTMNQYAAIEALSGPQDGTEAMRKVFEVRRNYIVKRMNEIPDVSCIMPDGAFYVMMNINRLVGRTLGGRLIENDDDFAVAFLEKGLVALVPCSGFGAPGFVRWTYAASLEDIREGMDRLEKFLK